MFIALSTNDFEVLIIMPQIRSMFLRVLVMRRYVKNVFGGKGSGLKKLSEFEKMSVEVELDIKSLHDSYVLLENCARRFNGHMNFAVKLAEN